MITNPEYMPKPPNTHSDINWVLHTEDPWLLAITLDSTNLVTQSECFLRVRWLLLWFPSHFCHKQPVLLQTETRATSVALPCSSSISSCLAGSHLANQVTSVSPFKKCRSWRLGREGSPLCPLLVLRVPPGVRQNLAFQ